jgi:hypothetical protein
MDGYFLQSDEGVSPIDELSWFDMMYEYEHDIRIRVLHEYEIRTM